jgi:hypothetical protein
VLQDLSAAFKKKTILAPQPPKKCVTSKNKQEIPTASRWAQANSSRRDSSTELQELNGFSPSPIVPNNFFMFLGYFTHNFSVSSSSFPVPQTARIVGTICENFIMTKFASLVSIGTAMGKPNKGKKPSTETAKKSTKDKDPLGPKNQGKDLAHHKECKDRPQGAGSTTSTAKATDLPPPSRSASATTTSSSSGLGETALDKARKAAASIKLKAVIATTKWPSSALAEAAPAFSKPPTYTAENAPLDTLAPTATPGSSRTGEFSGSTKWHQVKAALATASMTPEQAAIINVVTAKTATAVLASAARARKAAKEILQAKDEAEAKKVTIDPMAPIMPPPLPPLPPNPLPRAPRKVPEQSTTRKPEATATRTASTVAWLASTMLTASSASSRWVPPLQKLRGVTSSEPRREDIKKKKEEDFRVALAPAAAPLAPGGPPSPPPPLPPPSPAAAPSAPDNNGGETEDLSSMEMDEEEKGTESTVADDAAAVAAMPWSAPGSQEIGADDKPLEAMDIGLETLTS